MADFVAVIRRAVDGLSENTPEMRVRVYDKAKGAVVRQLENMKPRPPEAMFKRQLDKLDDAIRQVEEEHTEALPSEPVAAEPVAEPIVAAPAAATFAEPEEPVAVAEVISAAAYVAPEPVHVEPAIVETPVAREPAPITWQREEVAAEPVHETHEQVAAYVEPTHEEPVRYEEPTQHVEAAPAVEEARQIEAERYQEPARYEEPAIEARHEEPVYQAPVYEAPRVEERAQPVADRYSAHDDDILAHVDEPRSAPAANPVANRVMEQPFVEQDHELYDAPAPSAQTVETYRPFEDDARGYDAFAETPAPVQAASATPAWAVDIDREPEQHAFAPDPVTDEPAPQMPRVDFNETDVATGFNEFLKQEFSAPAVPPPPSKKGQDGDFSWDAPFDDLPDLPKPVAFGDALEAKQKELAVAPEPVFEARQNDARAELEDLIGYQPETSAGKGGKRGGDLPPEVTRAMSKLEGKSFKVQKKKKFKQRFNPLPIALGVVGALVVAGGAYGLYHYRDNVSAMVASYMPSGDTKPTDTRAVEPKPADTTKGATADKQTAAEAAQPAAKEEPTEVASLDASVGPTKFTQRLNTDGSEAETDTAKIPVDQSLTEGKTVAGQTDAGQREVASTDSAASAAAQQEKPATATQGLAVSQKMFLYEERLGGSPIAVPGTVTWSLKEDASALGGKKEPVVEAAIDVPERKLKAAITFRRNSDASLSASHTVEIVFDLPDDFPEGNVESIKRVAFKINEQDTGNSLIAVPAKITDDFHIIALNADADARKTNNELMKRPWIDIPIVYRNNRRALLTFEKGATGTEAFDKALAAWAALGAQVNNNE